MSDDEKDWIERTFGKLRKFWFVSVLLLAMTLLTHFDELVQLSESVQAIVVQWREILRVFWSTVLNGFGKLLAFEILYLESPIPERLT
ncbi:MAG: hypothetical protein AAFU65_10360, partial [Pseudomonadota bacterium]